MLPHGAAVSPIGIRFKDILCGSSDGRESLFMSTLLNNKHCSKLGLKYWQKTIILIFLIKGHLFLFVGKGYDES